MKVTIWHNPRCSKSREALKILQEHNIEPEVFKYLDEKPSKEEIQNVLKLLGYENPKELMRTKEAIYKELNLKEVEDEQKLLEAMENNPRLIERPILIKEDKKAIVGRPTEIVAEFITA